MLFSFFKKSTKKFDLPAYLECAECGEYSIVDGNVGQIKCPVCGSTRILDLEITTGKVPSWFKGDVK